MVGTLVSFSSDILLTQRRETIIGPPAALRQPKQRKAKGGSYVRRKVG
jgi:hypothetical protein